MEFIRIGEGGEGMMVDGMGLLDGAMMGEEGFV